MSTNEMLHKTNTGDGNEFASSANRPSAAEMQFVNARRAHTLQSTCQPTLTERSPPRTPNFNVAASSVAQLANSFPRKCPPAPWQNEDVNIEIWGRGGKQLQPQSAYLK